MPLVEHGMGRGEGLAIVILYSKCAIYIYIEYMYSWVGFQKTLDFASGLRIQPPPSYTLTILYPLNLPYVSCKFVILMKPVSVQYTD